MQAEPRIDATPILILTVLPVLIETFSRRTALRDDVSLQAEPAE